jgi:hypothetical protein
LSAAAALAGLAALNRESAALLPAVAVALHAWPPGQVPKDRRRAVALGVFGVLGAVVAARAAVGFALADNPGEPLQLFVDQTPRLLQNLAWLEDPAHWPLLPAYFGFVPLAWWLLAAWIPAPLRRLGWVALAYAGALLWVANVDEPRVYGEAIVLLYLPVAVGLAAWLRPGGRPV